MWGLIRKEWREHRGIVVGFAIAAPALSLLLKWGLVGWEDTNAAHSTCLLIPVLLLLLLTALAGDLVAADATSGRAAFLAALPIAPERVWLAKFAFLAGASGAYLLYLTLLESTLLLDLLSPADVQFLPLIAVVGAGTLFYSTLLDRGLAAVLATIATLGGVLLVVVWGLDALGLRFRSWSQVRPALELTGAMLTPAFLLGSFVAFTRGRIHLDQKLRRLALAAAVFLLLSVPAGAACGATLERWTRVEWGDRDLAVSRMETVLDGTWGYCYAQRTSRAPLGIEGGLRPGAWFLVHREDGRARNLSGIGHIVRDRVASPLPGHVRLYRFQPPQEKDEKPLTLVIEYDVENGRVTSTRPARPEEMP